MFPNLPTYHWLRASLLLLAISCCVLVAQTSAQAQPKEEQISEALRLTVLHTNDHHGRFWPNKQGEYGMPARKTLVDKIRRQVKAEGGHVLLLSGGDVNTGVPESDMLDAEPDFRGMALLEYDAMAVGNHEFDNPLEVIRRQQSWARFPFLSANIYHRRNGRRPFPAYKVFSFQGITIAVFGLTTENTANIGHPSYTKEFTFVKAIDEARALVPQLRKQADMVIALTHMGHYPDGQYGMETPGDVSLARAVEGIDLIVGGHSQDPVCMAANHQRHEAYKPGDPCVPDRQNGAIIVQAHEWGKYLGRADFVFRKRAKKSAQASLQLERYQLIPVNLISSPSPQIPPAAEMLTLLQPFKDKASKALYKKLASVNGRLQGDTKIVRNRQTNLGRLIATAQMQATKADLAIINSGGIRASIEAGEITVKDTLTVQPFNNSVCYVDLKGAELKQFLQAVFSMSKGSGGFPQTAGIERRSKESTSWWVTGNTAREIIDTENYRLAINDFIAKGGNNYPPLYQHPGFVNTGLQDAEVLQAFIQQLGTIEVKDFEP